jgi:hypothetical protein
VNIQKCLFAGNWGGNKIYKFLYFRVCGILSEMEMQMSTKTARLTIDLPRAEHKRLKMAAHMMDTSMKDLVLMSVEEFMQRKPNKVTMKAIKQSEEGKNLKKCDSLEDLFEDLGI